MQITIAHNAIVAKLVDPAKEIKLEVQRLLSYAVAGCEHMGAFKSGSWNGRSSFFEYGPGTFPRGFVELVRQGLTRQGHKVNVVKKPLPICLGPENPKVDNFPEDLRYDYQPHVVDKLVRHGQIIAQIATGGGKSRIAKLAAARINRPTLFLTTRSILMYQMRDSFLDITKRVGVIGDGEFSPINGINVGMTQTIIARLEDDFRREEMVRILEQFEFVILEEAHEVSGTGFYDIMRCCKNAHYRLSLTATPFMKDDEEANMRLMASSGPIAIRVSEKTLIDRGILARPYFKYVAMKLTEKPENLYKSTPWQRAQKVGLTENSIRNKHIVAESVRAKRFGLSVMVLVQQKAHGALLQTKMESAGLRVSYIFGEHNQIERRAALLALKEGKIDVLIGSTILDVGVDVPAVGLVILAGGGKAEVALRQRIGRGLREKKNGMPNVCFVLDFADDFNTHLKGHYLQRRALVEGTEGFSENIVQDFDYSGLGFVKKAA